VLRLENEFKQMAEVSGVTELQILESQLASLRTTLEAVERGDKVSVACARVIQSIAAAGSKDGFLSDVEGGVSEQNQYHAASGQGADADCCVLL
jgi:hypothetical protein